MNATVNELATGIWSHRAGQELEIVGPGANEHHLIVRRPGERKTFGFPVPWLDGVDNVLPVPHPARNRPRRPLRTGRFATGWPTLPSAETANSGELACIPEIPEATEVAS